MAPTSPSLQPEFDWPRNCDIKSIQHKQRPNREWKLDNGLWKNKNGEIFIGNKEKKIQMRLLVASHAGLSRHRGREATRANFQNKFWWASIDKDVNTFVDSCLHCFTSPSGDKIRRPLGHTMHAGNIDEVIHFDFC